jgi:hypothetical protein
VIGLGAVGNESLPTGVGKVPFYLFKIAPIMYILFNSRRKKYFVVLFSNAFQKNRYWKMYVKNKTN